MNASLSLRSRKDGALYATAMAAMTAMAPITALVSQPAQAAISVYADASTFTAALVTAGLAGVEHSIPVVAASSADPAGLVVGPVTFAGANSGIAATFFVVDGSYGFTSSFYSHQLFDLASNVNTVVLSFAAPVRGFAFTSNVMNPPLGDPINTNNWADSGLAALVLTTSAGDTTTVASPVFSNYASLPIAPPLGFNGLLSDAAFTSITMSVAQAANLQITGFTVASVPEVQSSVLLLVGLMGLGLVAHRRACTAFDLDQRTS